MTAIAGTIFDPAVNPLSPYKVGDNVAPVFRLPYAPQDILNATADWTMFHTRGGSLELALNYRYQGRQYDTAPTGPAVPGSTGVLLHPRPRTARRQAALELQPG